MTQVARKVEEARNLDARERALSQAAAQHEEAAEKLDICAARTATNAEDARAAAIAAGEDCAAAGEMRRAAEVVQRELDSHTLESETKMKVCSPKETVQNMFESGMNTELLANLVNAVNPSNP